ncbi:hypothetical protein CDD82_2300 [Ophiocordyceps australis]|uniref:Uncharacterized protein n=1 Tax=Ophiocordyceps australis TaxID=1399860 RepID=A0A2C5XV67_9HYPO|nr:hypothetical protein CDD82_2300 [Ophiocordyceps australis]
MPPAPAILEAWWLDEGYHALCQLVSTASMPCKPYHCDFASAVQRRLRLFDKDQRLADKLRKSMTLAAQLSPFGHGINYCLMLDEATHIFHDRRAGVIHDDQAMLGLALLDKIEMSRQQLVQTTRNVMVWSSSSSGHPLVVETLHREAAQRYAELHIGLRACILAHDLSQPDMVPAQAMARLNAFFPPTAILAGYEDRDLAPYSVALRDTIRFTVYEHIMTGNSASEQQRQAIQMKLFCWCNVPGYAKSIDALATYARNVKELEKLCIEALETVEETSIPPAQPLHGAEPSVRLVLDPNAATSPSPVAGATTAALLTDVRQPEPTAPPVPNPLLRGMPGREYSPAKTDGAAFSGDVDAPSVLTYPNDLSMTEFVQHPLANELSMTDSGSDAENSNAHAKLGAKSPSGLVSRSRRLGKQRSDGHPLPPIPESLKPKSKQKVLAKIYERIKSRTDAVTVSSVPMPQPSATGVEQRNSNVSSILGRGRRRPTLKGQVSSPELRSSARNTWTLPLEPAIDASASFSSGTGPQDCPVEPVFDKQAMFRLALPRLSPMEYTRLYLIEKSRADQCHQPCELPPPDKIWCWTSKWDSFLIIPKLPEVINRNYAPVLAAECPEQEDHGFIQHQGAAATELDYVAKPCPRLSLNLGGMTALFPSVMNLARLDVAAATDAQTPTPIPRNSRQHLRRSQSLAVCKNLALAEIVEETRHGDISIQDSPKSSYPASLSDTHLSSAMERSEQDAERIEGEFHLHDGGARYVDETQQDTPGYVCAESFATMGQQDSSSIYSASSEKTAVHARFHDKEQKGSGFDDSPSFHRRDSRDPSPSRLLWPVEQPSFEFSSSQEGRTESLSPTPNHTALQGRDYYGLEEEEEAEEEGEKEDFGGAERQSHELSPPSFKDGILDDWRPRSSQTMAAELQPAPLKVRKQRAQATSIKNAAECPKVCQGITEEINQKLSEFVSLQAARCESKDVMKAQHVGGVLERRARLRPRTPAGTSKTRWKSVDTQLDLTRIRLSDRNLELRHFSSTIVRPAQSRNSPPNTRQASYTESNDMEAHGFSRFQRQGSDDGSEAIADSPTLPVNMESIFSTATSRDRARPRLGGTRLGIRGESSSSRLETLDSPAGTAIPRPAAEPSSRAGCKDTRWRTVPLGDSSFALDRAGDRDSVTLLPRLRDCSRHQGSDQKTTAGRAQDMLDTWPRDDAEGLGDRARLSTRTPLNFQGLGTRGRLELASGRARTASRGRESLSPTPPTRRIEGSRLTRTPTRAVGNLFRKYSRSQLKDNRGDGKDSRGDGEDKTDDGREAVAAAGRLPGAPLDVGYRIARGREHGSLERDRSKSPKRPRRIYSLSAREVVSQMCVQARLKVAASRSAQEGEGSSPNNSNNNRVEDGRDKSKMRAASIASGRGRHGSLPQGELGLRGSVEAPHATAAPMVPTGLKGGANVGYKAKKPRGLRVVTDMDAKARRVGR